MLKRKLINFSKKITMEDIQKIEKKINCTFPKSLIDFYLKFNGGEVEESRKIFESKQGFEYEIKTFLPILYPRFKADSLLEDSYEIFIKKKKLIPENFIPFAMDSGGFRYCIDCKTEKVYFNNLDHIGEPADTMELVAPSISNFINGLMSEEEAYGD